MSNTVTAFHAFIDEHPETCLELTELAIAIHVDGRISPTEHDAIRQRIWEAWASFRADSQESAQGDANSDHAHADLPGALHGRADSESVTAARVDMRSAERARRRASQSYGKAMNTLSSIAPHEMRVVKSYVHSLNDELAAARVLRTLIEGARHE